MLALGGGWVKGVEHRCQLNGPPLGKLRENKAKDSFDMCSL